jgi:hypothetical protein
MSWASPSARGAAAARATSPSSAETSAAKSSTTEAATTKTSAPAATAGSATGRVRPAAPGSSGEQREQKGDAACKKHNGNGLREEPREQAGYAAGGNGTAAAA